jgi:ribonuclease MRP protein subunit RMP1
MDPQHYPTSRDIEAIYATLHLVYHRNRNQHRNTKWWKKLSMLKRSTFNLLCEIERFEQSDDDENVFSEMQNLLSKVLPKCYL